MVELRTKRLISMIMLIVLSVTLFEYPLTASAAGEQNTSSGSSEVITYVNSDGQKYLTKESNGFMYRVVNYDGNQGIEVYGFKNAGSNLTVPETIEGKNVISFAIDPRWPAWDEVYDAVESISLPKTIQYAHSKYMKYFKNLKSVSIAEGGKYYKSVNGVLYKYNTGGCQVAVYPRGKKDKTYVMPEDMNKMYRFFAGCPIESITMSKAITKISAWSFRNLSELKEIKVAAGNPTLFSDDGVLYENRVMTNYHYNKETGEETETEYQRIDFVAYPMNKANRSYTVLSGTEFIPYNSFMNNKYLEELTIPETVWCIDDYFMNMEKLNTVIFTSVNAPPADKYEYFMGLHSLMRKKNGDLNIKYPVNGTGFDTFIAWLKGKNVNTWLEEPELIYEEIPLGSNRTPLAAWCDYGTYYTVYSKTINGEYTEKKPDTAGTWYAKLKVDETDKYWGLESEPFKFNVIKLEEIPADNSWIQVPGNIFVECGKDFVVNGIPLFGEVDEILYKRKEDADVESNWSRTVPTEKGEYAYKLIVNGTDEYKGLIYISSGKNCWLTIEKKYRGICVSCRSVPVGETPQPNVSFWQGEEYDDVDLSKVYLKYYKYVEDEDGDGYILAELDEVPQKKGKYCVIAFYDSDTLDVHGSTTFRIVTGSEYTNDLIKWLKGVKYVSLDDKESYLECKKAYDSLTAFEKKAITEENVSKLDEVGRRLSSLEAREILERRKEEYDTAVVGYNAALEKAVKSKAEFDKVYSVSGADVVGAARKAKTDAEGLLRAAENMEQALDELAASALANVEAALNDPVVTRLYQQNCIRYANDVNNRKAEAAEAVTDAKVKLEEAESNLHIVTNSAESPTESDNDNQSDPGADSAGNNDISDDTSETGNTTSDGNVTDSEGNDVIDVATAKQKQDLKIRITRKKTIKRSKLRKSKTVLRLIKVKGAKGKLSFRRIKISCKNRLLKQAKKKISINSKNGNIILKKGLKKGTYIIKIRVTAAGSSNYQKESKTVKIRLIVK